MSRLVFVDSSAWIALASKDDHSHALARAFFLQEIQARRRVFATSNFVLSETLTLLRYRFGLTVAETFWQSIQESLSNRLLRLYPVTE
ncbi:MAG: hypothetical protein NZ874_09700, partial [Fimbriimonadales bacterium]|nr:hypothetical protein [Fimbriimonadales bacterium]